MLGIILSGYGCKYNFEIVRKKEWRGCDKTSDGPLCSHVYKGYYNDGESSMQKKKYGSAISLFKKSLKIAESNGANTDTINYRIAQVIAFSGDYHKALRSIDLVKEEIGNFKIYNKGIYALKTGLYENAILELYNHNRNIKTLKHECHWGIGFALMKMNQYENALTEFNSALSIRDNVGVRLSIVDIYFKTGQREKAIRALKKSVHRHLFDYASRQYLAGVYLNQGKVARAGKTLMFSNKSGTYNSLITYGNLLFKRNKLEKAERAYKKARVLNKNGAEALAGLGNINFVQNKFDKAQKYWNDILANDSANAIALEGLGLIKFKEHQDSVAFEYFIKAITLNKNHQLSYDALICVGYVLLKHNYFSDAKACFTQAINLSKNNSWAHAGLGFCLSSEPYFIHDYYLYSEAYKHFKKAVRLNKKETTFIAYLGITEYLKGKTRSAIRHLEAASSERPNDPNVFISLANCYVQKNEFDKAKTSNNEAIKIQPDNPKFLINAGSVECSYAEFLADEKASVNIDSILAVMRAFYDAALVAGGDTSVIMINTGVAYHKAQKLDSALIFYRKINKADSTLNAAKMNNIGVVHALKGDIENAKEFFNKAKSLDVKNRYASTIDRNIYFIERERSSLFGARRSEFISIYYYYLAPSDFEPQLKNDMHVPVIAAMPFSPDEIPEGFSYDHSKHSKTRISIRTTYKIKQPNHEPWPFCPK